MMKHYYIVRDDSDRLLGILENSQNWNTLLEQSNFQATPIANKYLSHYKLPCDFTSYHVTL